MIDAIIRIDGMRIYAHHGVDPQETLVGNEFVVTIAIDCDVTRAALDDTLSDTINYADVVAIAEREMQIPAKLLEHVAWRIIESIKSEFKGVKAVEVTIEKPTPPIAGLSAKTVSVTIRG